MRYYLGLVATFECIEADPMTGRARDLFRPGMRSVVYDASYLERAQRWRLPLATLDKALLKAAVEAGVERV